MYWSERMNIKVFWQLKNFLLFKKRKWVQSYCIKIHFSNRLKSQLKKFQLSAQLSYSYSTINQLKELELCMFVYEKALTKCIYLNHPNIVYCFNSMLDTFLGSWGISVTERQVWFPQRLHLIFFYKYFIENFYKYFIFLNMLFI